MIKNSIFSVLILVLGFALSACFGGGGGNDDDDETASGGLATSESIHVMSNRADLVSGGDVLIEVLPGAAVSPAAVSVQVNGRDVSSQFAPVEGGRLRGLVSGLALGRNTITAAWAGGLASAEVVNHPNGGPVFSGPQLQPWQCQDAAEDEVPALKGRLLVKLPCQHAFQPSHQL
ncbi:MAG: DUF6351 family protein, partial [Nevskiales bacterium]